MKYTLEIFVSLALVILIHSKPYLTLKSRMSLCPSNSEEFRRQALEANDICLMNKTD